MTDLIKQFGEKLESSIGEDICMLCNKIYPTQALFYDRTQIIFPYLSKIIKSNPKCFNCLPRIIKT